MDRRVLIIDDDLSILEVLKATLETLGYEVVTLESPEAALQELADHDFGAILTDLQMRGMSGLDLCREVVLLRDEIPVIVMTAFASLEAAIGAIRAGAYDFVIKPFDMDSLATTLERALQHAALHGEVKRLRDEVSVLRPFEEIVGESAAIKTMCGVVARIAATDASVLVTGESGTGKELVARALHARSPRSRGPFVAINCAAMSESLLESELFGHVKGAFTDAREARPGLFAKASGGTLFLDEIGEMPLGMQAKLLRALQERVVRPVGGDTEVPFDARIVTASNRDLDLEIVQKRFRGDLFYRINVVHIEAPPLRLRENDILLLAKSFLRGQTGVVGITGPAADKLLDYPWPGNVRELQNCIERAVALATTDRLGVDDLPDRVAQHRPSRFIDGRLETQGTLLPMAVIERRYFRQALDATRGNKASAARLLGVDRRTMYRKLEEWRKDDRT